MTIWFLYTGWISGTARQKDRSSSGRYVRKFSKPSSQEYIPMPKMNVITEEVDYAKIKEKESLLAQPRGNCTPAHLRQLYPLPATL